MEESRLLVLLEGSRKVGLEISLYFRVQFSGNKGPRPIEANDILFVLYSHPQTLHLILTKKKAILGSNEIALQPPKIVTTAFVDMIRML